MEKVRRILSVAIQIKQETTHRTYRLYSQVGINLGMNQGVLNQLAHFLEDSGYPSQITIPGGKGGEGKGREGEGREERLFPLIKGPRISQLLVHDRLARHNGSWGYERFIPTTPWSDVRDDTVR